MENISKRNSSIDIAKSIGIILVVLGHTDFFGNRFIYQFHLPLFFFLSGFVFSLKKAEDLKKFFIKRLKGLYFPFVMFETVFLIFHNFFVSIGIYNELSNVELYMSIKKFTINFIKMLTMGYGEQLVGPLWFLISTLEINIIFVFFAKISHKYEKNFPYFLVLICIILYFVGCYTNLPRMFSQSLIGIFFYCAGYVFRNYESKIDYKYCFFIFSIILVIICTKFNIVDISKLEITYKPLLLISGLSGIYMILFISNKYNFLKNRFLLYCGKNTIYVLALHCLAFKLIMFIEIKIYNENMDNIGLFPVYQKNMLFGVFMTLFGVVMPLIIKKALDISLEKFYEKKINKS